jgi:hypothetical protein
MTDVGYYEGVIVAMQQRLAEDDLKPTDWSDSDKLRLLALLFDEADIMRGVLNRHEVQDDLRRIADFLDE